MTRRILALTPVIAGVILLTACGSGSNDSTTTSSDSSSTTSANEQCAQQVYDALRVITTLPNGYTDEMYVAGLQDPIYKLATSLNGSFQSDSLTVGTERASENASAQAAELCSHAGDPTRSVPDKWVAQLPN